VPAYIIYGQSVRAAVDNLAHSILTFATGPKIVFILFRQRFATIQGVLTEEEGRASQNMVRWAEGISREAVVLVSGTLQSPPPDQGEVKSTTLHNLELRIEKVCYFERVVTCCLYEL
jgi:aspartyl/asparaginyl-tRNA synthetase